MVFSIQSYNIANKNQNHITSPINNHLKCQNTGGNPTIKQHPLHPGDEKPHSKHKSKQTNFRSRKTNPRRLVINLNLFNTKSSYLRIDLQ